MPARRGRVLLAVAAAGALALPARAARGLAADPAAAGSGASGPTRGSVVYATGRRAYLDRGTATGVHPGDVVALERNGRPAGTCTVEDASETKAVCSGDDVRKGDALAVATPAAAATPVVASLPPLLASSEVERGLAALASAPYLKVDEGKAPAPEEGGVGRVVVRPGAQVWVSSEGSSFEREHLQLSVRDAPIAGPLAAALELEAWRWGVGPRTKPNLLVWAAALTARGPDLGWAVGLGRLWADHAPGVAVIDGAEAAWRSPEHGLEAGIFGGAVPDPLTSSPRRQWLAGAYVEHERWGDVDALVRASREELRLSMRQDATGSFLGVGEASLLTTIGGWLDVGARALGSSAPSLDAAQLDLRMHPGTQVSLGAHGRYLGRERFDADLGSRSERGQTLASGNADVEWRPAGWIAVALVGGAERATDPRVTREYAGPEITLPTLLGRWGGLAFGYREEWGSPPGRSAFAQAMLAVLGADLLLRASYFEESPTALATWRELGLYAHVEAPLARWLRLRAMVLARADAGAIDPGSAAGTTAMVELEGRM